jgi:hypothetical protein
MLPSLNGVLSFFLAPNHEKPHDAAHPKVEGLVEESPQLWERGVTSTIPCALATLLPSVVLVTTASRTGSMSYPQQTPETQDVHSFAPKQLIVVHEEAAGLAEALPRASHLRAGAGWLCELNPEM